VAKMTDVRIELLNQEVKNLYKDLAETQKLMTRYYVEMEKERQKSHKLIAETGNYVQLLNSELSDLQQSLEKADYALVSLKIQRISELLQTLQQVTP
jgi:hypothetical protein